MTHEAKPSDPASGPTATDRIGRKKILVAGNPSARVSDAPAASQTMMLGGLLLAVIVVGAVSGLVAAKLSTGPQPAAAATDPAGQRDPHGQADPIGGDKHVYIELEPVVVNLDEHRLMRYVRVSVVLELDATNPKQFRAAQDLIERRRLVLKNRLTLFLAGRTPDEVRGDKALRHLERQILDDFNQQLWPNTNGHIRDVMFKEFAVQ